LAIGKAQGSAFEVETQLILANDIELSSKQLIN
jgi:hypothetical protein